ncbi:cupin domain-containing protein [cf. Phormidesmis sp. LEGE 11477]|uniref:polysaccharide biosynthesis C-terminal domain-containing protein n=1 Tax=cf. Phormidesmis sp. LEGE 11477 TaxID=1828680 RepID=UPI001881207F|nr:cupin domain-containing protein [cf. Phormidesmis sp. LEGE 11477]MBE9064536.1 cupin domain-containing protein [cf. Phormidesmis sp. LEGE 11477]
MPVFHSDDRGSFWQVAQKGWGEINFVETLADKHRGNHFHKENYELFFIVKGQVEVTVRSLKQSKAQTFLLSAGECLLIEPYELHTFYTRMDTQWMVMLSEGIAPENPDFHKASEFEQLIGRPLPKVEAPAIALN